MGNAKKKYTVLTKGSARPLSARNDHPGHIGTVEPKVSSVFSFHSPWHGKKNPALRAGSYFSHTSQMGIEAAPKAPEKFKQCGTKGRWIEAGNHKNPRKISSIKNDNRFKREEVQFNSIQFNVQVHLELHHVGIDVKLLEKWGIVPNDISTNSYDSVSLLPVCMRDVAKWKTVSEPFRFSAFLLQNTNGAFFLSHSDFPLSFFFFFAQTHLKIVFSPRRQFFLRCCKNVYLFAEPLGCRMRKARGEIDIAIPNVSVTKKALQAPLWLEAPPPFESGAFVLPRREKNLAVKENFARYLPCRKKNFLWWPP